MAKQRTDLERQWPSPPYTRWDQRKKPFLLCHLKNIDSTSFPYTTLFRSPDIARGHMRLIVAWLLAKGQLSPDWRTEFPPRGCRSGNTITATRRTHPTCVPRRKSTSTGGSQDASAVRDDSGLSPSGRRGLH